MKVARLVSGSLAASVLTTSSLVLGLVALSACGGFSTEDAEARCDQEEEARAAGGCFTNLKYEECVAAFEECGSDVNIDDSCPLSFSCPE